MTAKQDWQGTAVYSIENDELAISLIPAYGNNLYRIWDKKAEREVLRTPDSPAELADSPGKFGTPLMMPPNRIREGRFTYGGRDYQFDCNTPDGNNHIHGFLRGFPWTIDESRSSAGELTSQYRTKEYPDVIRQYPHDLEITMTYKLDEASVRQIVSVRNNGSEPAPFGYGLHTWFKLDGVPEQWSLTVPVEEMWELTPDCLPTGSLVPLGKYEELKTGMSLGGVNLDHVFQIGNHPCLAVLKKDGYELRYSAPEGFKQWVIFTAGQAAEWICLEPYTWVTDAPNLALPSDVTGLRAIAPGETIRLEVLLELVR